MKTKRKSVTEDLRPEYEFNYTTAVRGKYYQHLLKEGANVVVLEPDVAKAFRASCSQAHQGSGPFGEHFQPECRASGS